VIGGYEFITLKETTSSVLKTWTTKSVVRFEKTLTEGEIESAKSLFGDRDIKPAPI